MKPLEMRKQLLIVESELNRAQLMQEWQTLTDEVDNLAERVGYFKSIAASAISLVTRLTDFAGEKNAGQTPKTSWLQKITSGARLASSVWAAVNNLRKK